MSHELKIGAKVAGQIFLLLISTTLSSCAQGSKTVVSTPTAPQVTSSQNSYEAEASGNTLHGQAAVQSCTGCWGGSDVGSIGNGSGNYLIINGIQTPSSGAATVTVYYVASANCTLFVSVNGASGTSYSLSGSTSKSPATMNIAATLNAGSNTIKFYNDSAAAPDIDRIVVTSVGGGFGLLSSGLRDKTQWPFASDAIWNTAIGSGAVYQPAGIVSNTASGYPTRFVQDPNVIVMTPTAPLTGIYYNGVAWNGGDRCPAQGKLLATVPIPAAYTLPSSGENNSTAILMPDGTTVEQNQPFTRCVPGGVPTSLGTTADVSIYGTATSGAHGGSALSALGGTIRLGEFTSGKIQHAMEVNLWAAQYYHCCTYHWPATTVDGYSNATTYGGPNPNFGPGTLLALPPTFDVTTLTTTPGRILAQAFKDYGAYVADDSYWNAWAIETEQGPNGQVVNEFIALYGFSMRPAAGDPFMSDMKTIFEALQIVTNNSAASVGGGGTPRQPSPPAIGN